MSDSSKDLYHRINELTDIVEALRQENSRLREKAQQADEANRAKSDFLTMISHEIRTPMNGVIGLTELLLRTRLDEKQSHFAELILHSARNLLFLINSILDFSKIEAEQMALEIDRFSPTELVDELMKLYRIAGLQKGIDVHSEIDPRLKAYYFGDDYRIRQIIVNLLGNAIKFTDRGSVIFSMKIMRGDEQSDEIRFEVRDSGPGIAADKIERLFVPFYQIDSSTTRLHGGTGLGLSICEKLVRMMGGKIGVESEVGHGSIFWFDLRLPVAGVEETPDITAMGETVPSEKVQAPFAAAPLPHLKPNILIVDDDLTNQTVMREIFSKTCATIATANNGQEAVELCKSEEFDLIFMDCQMPVMDGFRATRAIHNMLRPDSKKNSVIVALTADATAATRQRCLDVGMEDHLLKPLDFRELQRVVDSWIPQSHILIRPYSDKAENEPSAEERNGQEESPLDIKTLDRLKQNIGNIQPVIKVFLASLPERLHALQLATEAKDFEKLRSTGHILKGSSGQFGAKRLAALCLEVEKMSGKENIGEIRQLIEEIHEVAFKVAAFLSEELD